MTHFELIQDIIHRIEEVENDLKLLRETSEPFTSETINETLETIADLYQKLKGVDMALEKDKMGYVLF